MNVEVLFSGERLHDSHNINIYLLGQGCLYVVCRYFQRKCLSKNWTTRCMFDDDGKIASACRAPGR